MARCIIAAPNLVDSTFNTVQFSGGSYETTKPLSNIADPIFINSARTTDAALASAQGQVDLGSQRGLRVTMIPKHNIRKRGKIFHRYSKLALFSQFNVAASYTTGDDTLDQYFEAPTAVTFPMGSEFKFANHDTVYKVTEPGYQGQNYAWGGNDAESYVTEINTTVTADVITGPDGGVPGTLSADGWEVFAGWSLAEDNIAAEHYGDLLTFADQSGGQSFVNSIFVKKANRSKCRFHVASYDANQNETRMSDALDDAVWTKTNVTATADQLALPGYGYATAEKVLETTANAVHQVDQTVAGLPANSKWTLQAKVKAVNRTKLRLYIIDNATPTDYVYAQFDLTAVTVASTGVGGTGVVDATACSITLVEDGVYLVVVTGTPSSASDTGILQRIQVLDDTGTTSYAGDAAKGLYAGNVQLELYDKSSTGTEGATWYIPNASDTDAEGGYGMHGAWMDFDMDAGTIITVGVAGNTLFTDYGSYYVGDGWYRLWFAQTNNTMTTLQSTRLHILDDDGNVYYQGEESKGFYAWGQQCRQGEQPDRVIISDTNFWSSFTSGNGWLTVQFTPALTDDVPAGTAVVPMQGDYWSTAPAHVVDWEEVWKRAYNFGDVLFGAPEFFDLMISDEDAVGYNYPYINIATAPFVARYWEFRVDNTTNPDEYIELSRVFLALGWQPSINLAYGASIGWTSDAQVVESLGAVEFIYESSLGREIRGTLDYLDEDEAFQYAFEIDRRTGKANQVAIIFNPDDTIHRHRRSFVGRFAELSQLEFPTFGTVGKAVQIKEVRG